VKNKLGNLGKYAIKVILTLFYSLLLVSCSFLLVEHISEKAQPIQKGEGTSIMVSDFCSPDLGWLKSKDG